MGKLKYFKAHKTNSDLKSIFDTYRADSVAVQETAADVIRNLASTLLPTKPTLGYLHIIRELLDNADDESAAVKHLLKSADTVEVEFDEDTKKITVSDNGRGFPHEKVKDLAELLYSSGKYNKSSKKSGYKVALGRNGVGLKLAVYMSERVEISTTRDNICKRLVYEDGVRIHESDTPIKKGEKEHGTTISFIPSHKYLPGLNNVTHKMVEKVLVDKTDAFPGMNKKFVINLKSGKRIEKKLVGLEIDELLDKYHKITTKKWLTEASTTYINENKKSAEEFIRFKLAFGYDSKMTEVTSNACMGWCNYSFNSSGGDHVNAVIEAIDTFARKSKSMFTEKERKDLTIKKEDIKLGLCFVVIIEMTDADFSTQYKHELTSTYAYDFVFEKVLKYLNSLPEKDIKALSDIIKSNIKARLASQKARQTVKKVASNLSSDRIDKYITTAISYTGDIKEVSLCEGDSAGDAVRMARFPFQEVYKLRGRVDNIIDMDIATLSKLRFIQDMSRITGLVPGKRGGTPRHDIYSLLTDADPDGRAIRVGITVAFYKAFPEIIEKGLLYIIQPPAYSFEYKGKTVFVSSNREYFEFLKDRFVKENSLYYEDSKYSNQDLVKFIQKNERYVDRLTRLSDYLFTEPKLVEIIVSFEVNETDGFIKKEHVKKLDKAIKTHYSKEVNVTWDENEDCVLISGFKEYVNTILHLNSEVLKSHRYNDYKEMVIKNYGNIIGYNITSTNSDKKDISLYEVLSVLYSYKGSRLKRFKGLGQMSRDDLRNTCLDPNKRQLIQVTMNDVEAGLQAMINWYSGSTTEYRKDYMLGYVYDILEIDT